MEPWLLDELVCPAPECGGGLAVRPGAHLERQEVRVGLLGCEGCGALYPIVAGVPILVPDPPAWLASYRDPVLATLAEHGAASPEAMTLVDSVGRSARDAEPLRFGDDWTRTEADDADEELRPPVGTGAAIAFGAFLDASRGHGPDETLLEVLGEPAGTVWEIGCGAGTLSRRLRRRAERLILTDLSLRAVLRARSAAAGEAGGALAAVVADAEALPIAPLSAGAIVAAELVDLLEQPERFLSGAAEALGDDGRLLLATPAPDLGWAMDEGGQGGEVLDQMLEACGLAVAVSRDAIPWVRAHRPRYFQVYFVRVLAARHAR